ncbi:Delta-60 repeat protein [Pseudomonas sp. IT-P12]|uniref:hypothetical protein n=1 Tax=Pseudomonas sp. IT-P12 TaxID=3026450 RepID=UPI0039E193B1
MTLYPRLAAGDLDSSFANAGILVLTYPGFSVVNGQSIAEGPQGKIYVLGGSWHQNSQAAEHISITRLLPDGTFDFGFGTHGTAHIKLPNEDLSTSPIQLFFVRDQEEDLMLVSVGYNPVGQGTITQAEVLIRLTGNGVLDKRFGVEGFMVLESPFDADVRQPVPADTEKFATPSSNKVCLIDGMIYLITSGLDPALGYIVGVVSRFNFDGNVDPTFGKNGHATLSGVLGTRNSFNGIAVNNGTITVCGWAGGGALIARFNLDGGVDPSFAGIGYILLAGPSFQFQAVAILPDGRTVATGFGYPQRRGLLAVYAANGLIDRTFNNGAHIEEGFDPPQQVMFLNVEATDDKILVSGRYFAGLTPKFVTAKYLNDGERDTSYGSGQGYAITEIPGYTALANGMSLQADKKILLVANDLGSVFSKAAIVARLLNSD